MTRQIAIREIDMRPTTQGIILALILGLAACGQSASTTARRAQQTADTLTGDAAGAAADNPQCRMFTPAEISTYLGAPAKIGPNAAMGSGCQWTGMANDGASFVMLQIVAARDHSPPSAAPGFKKLADIGTKGFVVPQMSGWQAGAIQGDTSINVTISGASVSEARTTALLREAVKRAGAK
jgi:hypothetical protein